MTTDELVAYYVALIIIQYANRPRAVATVDAFVRSLVADQVIQQVEDAYDLATATGVQLDALGTYVGASRTIVGIDLGKTFFTTPTYAASDKDTVPGFAFYADGSNVPQYFAFYADGQNVAYVLTDPDFRLLIQYLAKLNALDLGLGSIDQFLFEFFGTYVTLTDNGDMTITYADDPADPSNLFTIVNFIGAFPQPAGVEIIVS